MEISRDVLSSIPKKRILRISKPILKRVPWYVVTRMPKPKFAEVVPCYFITITMNARLAGINVREYCTDAKKCVEAQQKAHEVLYGNKPPIPFGFMMIDVLPLMEGPWGGKVKYFDTPYDTPVVDEFAIKKAEDWEKIEVMDPKRDARLPFLNEIAEIIVNNGGLYIAEGTSPLTMATRIHGMEQTYIEMKLYPDLLKKGLKTIAETEIEHLREMSDIGGLIFVFSTITRCSADLHTWEEYEEFGKPYDLMVLNEIKRLGLPPTVVHICGLEPYFDHIASEYPHVICFSWWDKGSKLTLKEAKERYGKDFFLMGGLDQNRTMLYGTPREVEAEAMESIRIGKPGGNFVLSTGCELSARTPIENCHAAIRAAKRYGMSPGLSSLLEWLDIY
jgi:uroporphyrinogen decarboxylase